MSKQCPHSKTHIVIVSNDKRKPAQPPYVAPILYYLDDSNGSGKVPIQAGERIQVSRRTGGGWRRLQYNSAVAES